MSNLSEQIKQNNATAFTHSGKFHADDVFSSALLLYLNPEIRIIRENKVPEDFDGIVFDIGRGRYDHHQKDSRIRENGIPYAAFGLLWEKLGPEILGEELAQKFDESFVQPLDNNDNTGEKNELATLIGNFNPTWDAQGGNDEAFFQAVSVAGMILAIPIGMILINLYEAGAFDTFVWCIKEIVSDFNRFRQVPAEKKE